MIPLGFVIAMGCLAVVCIGVAGVCVWAFNRLADATIDDRPAE